MRAVWKHAVVCTFAISSLLLYACNDVRPEKNMDKVTSPPLAAETEALRQAYAAFNRNDIPATVVALDPQIEWTEPPEFPGGGITYRGHAGVQAYLSTSRENWTEGSSEPERFIPAGDKIVVFVHARARLKGSTEWHETRLADVFTFRNGKAIQMHAFADRHEALEWAGVKASDVK
jgi:ketosteroid isomerase-like protein